MQKTTERYVPRSLYLPKSVDKRLVTAAREAGDYISQFARKVLERGLDAHEQKAKAK